MEELLNVLRAMKCCVCFPTKRPNDGYNLQAFLDKKLPIFWVMGPQGVGKSTLAAMLAKSSKYRLVRVSQLVKEEAMKGKWRGRIIQEFLEQGGEVPDEIVLNLIKEEFIVTQESAIGYVIDGFPLHLRQAKHFEREICKVSMVIYVTLVMDAVLARLVKIKKTVDADTVRIKHIQSVKLLDSVYNKYENRAIKLHSNYTPEETCTRLVENLEDFWGYKFQRLYVKT